MVLWGTRKGYEGDFQSPCYSLFVALLSDRIVGLLLQAAFLGVNACLYKSCGRDSRGLGDGFSAWALGFGIYLMTLPSSFLGLPFKTRSTVKSPGGRAQCVRLLAATVCSNSANAAAAELRLRGRSEEDDSIPLL